jgi:hypothetical protein
MHQTVTAAFRYFVSKIGQPSVSAKTINQSRFPILPRPSAFLASLPHHSAGYSLSCRDPSGITGTALVERAFTDYD